MVITEWTEDHSSQKGLRYYDRPDSPSFLHFVLYFYPYFVLLCTIILVVPYDGGGCQRNIKKAAAEEEEYEE